MSLVIEKSDEYNNLGEYYSSIEDYKKMEEFYLDELNKGNIDGFTALREYYEETDRTKLEYLENTALDKIFLIAVENKNTELIKILGFYYEDYKKYEQMKKCALLLLENNKDDLAGNLYLAKYYKEEKDYDNMLLYYHNSILIKENPYIYCEIAFHYCSIENYNEMLKYYQLAIDKNYTDAMYFVGLHYHYFEVDYDKAILYYKMALENNICHRSYKNNIINFLNKIKECIICYEHNIHIKLTCGHDVCVKCVNQLDRCYYRCG
jgi:tetratricopeptide (TPR) repeat protein